MNEKQDLKILQRAFYKVAFTYIISATVFLIFIQSSHSISTHFYAYLTITGTLSFILYKLWISLSLNYREDGLFFQSLGWPNILSLLRGLLLCLLSIFIFIPNLSELLVWWVAVIFTTAILTDGLDGYLARKTQRQTELGKVLDIEIDSVAVLIGAMLAISFGKLPLWYIIIALARYLFVFGTAIRKYFGHSTQPLQESLYRRTLAVANMNFMMLALYPSTSPEVLEIMACFATIPFCLGFIQDWLIVNTFIRVENKNYQNQHQRFCFLYFVLFPIALRVSLIIALFFVKEEHLLWLLPLVILGIYGRISVLLLIIIEMFSLHSSQHFIDVYIVSSISILALNGLGKYTLWSPEEKWNWGYRVQ